MRHEKNTKVALIGPMLPWRGGIAQYTSQLLVAMQNNGSVFPFSFKTLYPKFLYPGAEDKDTNAEFHKNVDYRLSIYNPVSIYSTARRIEKEGCEIAFIDWWTIIWQPGLALLAWLLKHNGVKPIFICHNVFDHDAGRLTKLISGFFLKQAEGYVVHSSEQAHFLASFAPGRKVLNTILPIYEHYPEVKRKLKKRGDLELLYFGFIRPYKGVDVLLDAMKHIDGSKKVYLTIVGEYWGDVAQYENEIKKRNIENLEYHLKYVDDIEASSYFDRADVVVLPYRSATGSAVVSLAYGRKKPVIASNVGGLGEAVVERKTGWLVAPEKPKELAKVINETTRSKAESMSKEIEDFCQDNSWSQLAVKMLDSFEKNSTESV